MSELRKNFEELPDIKGILHGSDFCFNESLNQYYHPDHTNHRLSYAFIMGAWYAFQKQQADVDQLKTELALCREENKGLIGKVNEQKKRIEAALKITSEVIVSKGNSVAVTTCRGFCRELEKALRGEHENN